MAHLDELDGREVHVFFRPNQTDFDRRVRDAMDRIHRRQQIAEN